jgi:flagellar hook protein FlgE
MLKSLYSGVSGLQSHQIAMDVESNNIANVNTTGFKYSRANFSDLLAQTSSIATAPQGELGGKNAVQVGLGSSVKSMTRIFSQGSIQNSDKNTDVAIQGDGFFIISPDGGNTYKYTRAGDFKFDANGNFVDNNGFITQGWTRDETTGLVDSTAPINNINIAPGLTTPANPTNEVVLKANLNSGTLVESFSQAYSVPSGTPPSQQIPAIYTGDAFDSVGNPIDSGNLGVMFNEVGEAFSLQANQGVWMSFLSSTVTGLNQVTAGAGELDVTFKLDDGTTQQVVTTGGLSTNTVAQNGARYVSALNAQSSTTGITATYDATNNKIILVNDNSNVNASHNIEIKTIGNANAGFVVSSDTTAYKYQYNPSGSDASINAHKTFTTMADLRYAMEQQARAVGDHNASLSTAFTVTAGDGTNEAAEFSLQGPDGIAQTITVANGGGSISESGTVKFVALAVGETVSVKGLTLTAGAAGMTAAEVAQAFASASNGVTPSNPTNGTMAGSLTGWGSGGVLNTDEVVFTHVNVGVDEVDLVTGGTNGDLVVGGSITNGGSTADENGAIYAAAINNKRITGITAAYDTGTKQLTIHNTNNVTSDLVVTTAGLTGFAAETIAAGGDGVSNENNIEIIVNDQGKFEIKNPGGSPDGDYDMNLKITALSDTAAGITANKRFTTNLGALNAVLPAGSTGKAYSQSFNAATHSSSIDIFDSLGSKHTLRMELRKTALDTSTGSTWDLKLSVPEPATIDTLSPYNEKTGSIRFNNDGSIATYNPPNLSFSGNNGSAPDQQVNLSFGTANGFDGMTSFDAKSSTSGISQDGYTGGDIVGIRIDQSGTVIGSFSNGRSFGLAQIAMAKFTNNEGLATEGGNVYIQTANSGDPTIGTAATSGRGFIQSSALEASNVDLSRALTQLIIIQRGYQANGKTITTSDQLLQTLIGLKN